MTTNLHETVTTAYLQGDEVVLEDFREPDPDVVALVRESDDAEFAVHRCLGMGARVLRLAGATLDTQLVEHRFSEMTGALDRSIESFAQRVDESAEKLLDEESGDLATALRTWLEEVTSALDATFDESSKKSAVAKLEAVLEKARREQVTSMRSLLDPENIDSPLAGWRREIVKTVERQGKNIEQAVHALREQLAIGEARAEEAEHGTRKGFAFEDVVRDQVVEIVRHLQDSVESTAKTAGSSGSQVGDLVVTLDPAATPGRTVCWTLEVKDRHLTQKVALGELDEAIANRDASAGVMVFSRQANCPVKTPFQWFDHKALVVLDKEELDPHALRLASLWARWICLREEATDTQTIDTARVAALLDAARSSLATASTIKSCHTQAKKAIDQAGGKLDTLVTAVRANLDELEEAVCGIA